MAKRITLACNECKEKNYRLSKSFEERMEIKKFCKRCGQHTVHREEK